MKRHLSLNADVGEGSQNDEALMPYLTRCSIACGGHYGDRDSIDQTLDLAIQHQVKVGAHPSYPDLENFGRSALAVSQELLMESLAAQIQLMKDRCQHKGVEMDHIKPHGRFYNDLHHDKDLANAWLNLLQQAFEQPVTILVAPNSAVQKEAKDRNFPYLIEVFADRNYQDDGSLVPRKEAFSLITDKQVFKKRLDELADHKQITSINGKQLSVQFDTLCIHSDSDAVVENLKFAFEQ